MDDSDGELDRLLNEAIAVIAEYDRASASLLQRRLRVGYARAAHMIDQLEQLGYIAPFDGSNARAVLHADPIDLPPPDPAFVAAIETVGAARTILGLSTPALVDVPDQAVLDEFAYVECATCGRLEAVEDAADAVKVALASSIGDDWWAVFRLLAARGELRAAVLQKEQRLTFEDASDRLADAATLGLLRRTGLSWSLTEPRCATCLGSTIAVRDRRPEVQYERDPIPAQMRFRVLQRDGFRCAYCGLSARDGAVLHVDHVVPVAAGGETTEDNLIAACSSCNLGKSASSVL